MSFFHCGGRFLCFGFNLDDLHPFHEEGRVERRPGNKTGIRIVFRKPFPYFVTVIIYRKLNAWNISNS